MESALTWLAAGGIAFAMFAVYFARFRTKVKEDAERKAEAVHLGSDRPVAQYPQIDELQCIGCGACIDACPEGDVLGIVSGRATIINGLRCIGHGRCAEACPVGAIRVGIGSTLERDDLPLLGKGNETTVPGVFIAGELSGFALIRNAVAQGKMVIDEIASRGCAGERGGIHDVVIIGAGPAGLSAAAAAVERKLSCIVLDQQGPGGTILQYPRKKLVLTRPMKIPLYGTLDKSEYSKEELLEVWEEVIDRLGIEVRTGCRLTGLERKNDRLEATAGGGIFRGRHVVLALGRRGTPRRLGVEGEDRSKVMYKLLDAESYDSCRILVVGGGDSAVEAAAGLARKGVNTVHLSYRKEKIFRVKKKNAEALARLERSGAVDVLYRSNVESIGEKTVTLRTPDGLVELENDYVFIFAGGTPPFALLKGFGISFGEGDAGSAAGPRRAGVVR